MKARIKFAPNKYEEYKKVFDKFLEDGEVTAELRNTILLMSMELSTIAHSDIIPHVNCNTCDYSGDCSMCIHWSKMADCYERDDSKVEVRVNNVRHRKNSKAF